MMIFGLASFDKGHLDNISIVTCIEIQKTQDGIYHMKAEIADTGGSSDTKPSEANLISAEGMSIREAYQKLSEIDSSSIYVGHVRLILFDLNTAEEDGFEDLANFILQSNDMRFNIQIALYDSKSGDILDSETFITGNKGLDVSRGIRNAAATGENVNTEAFQVINYADEKTAILFPVVSTIKMNDRTISYVMDTAVFCDGKLKSRGKLSDITPNLTSEEEETVNE